MNCDAVLICRCCATLRIRAKFRTAASTVCLALKRNPTQLNTANVITVTCHLTASPALLSQWRQQDAQTGGRTAAPAKHYAVLDVRLYSIPSWQPPLSLSLSVSLSLSIWKLGSAKAIYTSIRIFLWCLRRAWFSEPCEALIVYL